jgi:hypothetical protein
MENPKITTKIKHSESKSAWNVIGTKLGGKYKIARVPYVKVEDSTFITECNNLEAKRHAEWISFCFNNSDNILASRGNF